MLKRENRLKSRGDFKRTLAGRRLCANDAFAAYGLGSQNPVADPRFGFIVSKKVHKRAVVRNRIKRRLRELVRTWLLKERPASLSQFRTVVFIARGGSLQASYQDLREKMQRCFAQIK